MTHAIRFHQTGGPEVPRREEIALPPPTNEARVKLVTLPDAVSPPLCKTTASTLLPPQS